MIKIIHEFPAWAKFKKFFNIFSIFWCIVFVVNFSKMWSVEKMRSLWRISALLASCGCSAGRVRSDKDG